MLLEDLIEESYATAEEKGWHDEPRSLPELIALAHAELSEALEAYRSGEQPLWFSDNGSKPEGIAVEFADVLIRIFDTCRTKNLPLCGALSAKMAYNKTRPYRHGGKLI